MNVIHRGFKARLSRRELDTCEVLRKYPHHNIAAYHGVECATKLTYMPHDKMMEARFDTERVTKLIFTRYDHNLWDLATRSQMVRVDVVQCLSSIEAGIRRLHSLGIVHCDIKLDNLFVKRMVSQGNRVYFLYVVGDFDSCHRVDERLRLKIGDVNWTKVKPEGSEAEKDDDWYAFGKLKV
ncbi:hypothetical protein CC86DRAFT_298223 [Ophiobolus disseminans]|uniref:Protein kinase domain-containing protein n=1 Tax=Ophiobolus disseminans TaxID=1469910 RepID=A0A6A6ZRV6_9PLEO|nr:hypothetical protein CC86DRAFT_298223 [Ophiobolus disseminans]